jgi:tetratricopeptide (TPR) repeat protein
LPKSEDGAAELVAIDRRIEIHEREPNLEIALLLDRALFRGRLEDYQEALARSEAWVRDAPESPDAWNTRVRALAAVHRFAAAREALARFAAIAHDDQAGSELEATLDEATGHVDRALAFHRDDAKRYHNPISLTRWAAGLAQVGELDAAIALVPRAAGLIHATSPELLSWLLFQWGRLYEQKGEPAAARELYAASRARLPALEPTVHLAQMMIKTGDSIGAAQLVGRALGELGRHPSLLELDPTAANLSEAREAWERYVAALPEAFADHAARFYLGPGAAPARALALARANLANRETREARSLVVEAALAAGEAGEACAAVGTLAEPSALRAQRFVAWRALLRCGRRDEADRLAAQLGIARPNQ